MDYVYFLNGPGLLLMIALAAIAPHLLLRRYWVGVVVSSVTMGMYSVGVYGVNYYTGKLGPGSFGEFIGNLPFSFLGGMYGLLPSALIGLVVKFVRERKAKLSGSR